MSPDPAVMQRLLRLAITADAHRSLDEIVPPDRHDLVRRMVFLFQVDATGVSVERFVTRTLERLLCQLVCRTDRELNEYHGRVRGRVAWPETLKTRYSGDYDPSRFVCLEVQRRFDTPENQLLKFVIEEIRRSLQAVPAELAGGWCFHPIADERGTVAIEQRLAAMETVLNRFKSHSRLRRVSLPKTIMPLHQVKCESSRVAEYGVVARLYEVYRRTVAAPHWDGVRRCARSVLLLPARCDESGEIWLRLAAALLAGADTAAGNTDHTAAHYSDHTARRTAGSPTIT